MSDEPTQIQPNLMIATPTSHLTPLYIHSMEQFCEAARRIGMGMSIYRETGDGIVRARNRSVARFLKSDCTHLFFIDDDIGFSVDDAMTLISCGLDVVCGVYPKKEIDWNAVVLAVQQGVPADKLAERASTLCFGRSGDGTQAKVLVDNKTGHRFVRIHDGPTGFMCIRRHVIEKMIETYGDSIAYLVDYEESSGGKHHALFHMDRDPTNDTPTGRYLSEDYWFCRQWQRMGGEIYAFAECRLQHYGHFTYDGCLANMLTTGVMTVADTEAKPAAEEQAAE
jgi:hypothetical protein